MGRTKEHRHTDTHLRLAVAEARPIGFGATTVVHLAPIADRFPGTWLVTDTGTILAYRTADRKRVKVRGSRETLVDFHHRLVWHGMCGR